MERFSLSVILRSRQATKNLIESIHPLDSSLSLRMTRRIPFDTLMGDKMAQFYLYYRKLDRPQRKIYFDPFGDAKPYPLGWCTKRRSESTLRSGLQAGEPKG
jgi:hypothetical protein